ncbi:hypothetical protein O0L34_g5675 [Tuta absoluta]|nr:hypothetical protein O0L34_g5675 [Tuta absoluta]
MGSVQSWWTTGIDLKTSISLLISWLTLECKLQPEHPELQEVTITKLLYLYDPQSCGRVYFYNYTVMLRQKLARTTIQWPVKNEIARRFRKKIKLWVAVHILWMLFCVIYMTQGHRPCGFYATLIPFTVVGLMVLGMDVVYTGLFLADTKWTNTEDAILKYINMSNTSILTFPTMASRPFSNMIKEPMVYEDTSWISLLFAYASSRGIVLWVFNFWMIKDNYFEGLVLYRQSQIATENV